MLRVHPRGFGFVDLDPDPNYPPGSSAFVPPPAMDGLVDLDRVRVELSGALDRLACDSVTVLERVRTEVAATVADDDATTAVPDPHLAHGTWTLDTTGLTARPQRGDTLTGTLDGTVVRAHESIPADDLVTSLRTRVLIRYTLPRTDPVRSTNLHLAHVSSASRRRDLTDQVTLTIDADHSEDLDDALSVIPADDTGAIKVLVHISDVTEHLDDLLDTEAREVATSIYMPSWRRPMLPRTLSEDLLSLRPGVERDALTVEYRIDPTGEVTAVDVFESRIRSDIRLSYAIAAAAIANRDLDLTDRLVTGLDVDDLADTLAWLRCAAARLGAARSRRGGLDARRVDPELAYDLDGTPAPLQHQGQPARESSDEAPAHEMIERLMVAANEAVATWLADRGLPGVFRVHQAPDADAAAEIDQFCEQLGFHTGLGPTVTPLALAALDHQLALAHSDAASHTFELMLARMPRATYTTAPGPHFGLGSSAYLHFTSPIRRYADVCVHKVVKAYLAGCREFDDLREDFTGIVGHINESTARAARAEGQLRRSLWMVVVDDAVRTDRTRRFQARVTSVDDKGVRAVLDGTAVWGRLAFADLPGRWDRTGPGTASSGEGDTLTIGESVTVTVTSVDPVACVLNLAPVRTGPRPPRRH